MKSKKLTRAEDFISMSMPFGQRYDQRGFGCTTKRYFVQNKAISFGLINVASQSSCNDRFVRWRTSLFALVCKAKLWSPSVRLALATANLRFARRFARARHANQSSTKLRFVRSLTSYLWIANRRFAKQGHRQTQKPFRKALLKRFQIKEYVTFSKLVPKELFLIQNIQNPCKTHYTIVRPLINCSRHTITMACFLNRLPVYPDITNKKVRYSRNRIRKQIIPSLQFFFNPEVEKALFKFSELQASGGA